MKSGFRNEKQKGVDDVVRVPKSRIQRKQVVPKLVKKFSSPFALREELNLKFFRPLTKPFDGM